MRLKKTFTLRTFLFGFTAIAVLFGAVVKPVHEYRREQSVLATMPVVARITSVDNYFFDVG